ncbi:MAG: ATP-binding cassette domain-containing protein [Actinomycetota bacterium]|nr:ATP-binding cassette domain-containing protein [Actinomycetota bacterium]
MSAADVAPAGPVLDLRSVRKAFSRGGRGGGTVLAVDDVSLTLRAGEIVGLVGESGAGKSTLGRIILGLERPDHGEVVFQGVDLARLGPSALRRARRRMHFILQDPYQSLHPGMRLEHIVAEPLAIAGVDRDERRARAAAALEEVGLAPPSRYVRRFPHELSGGQRQRVAVARALVGRPCLAVADEPTSMLDASVRAAILELITGIRGRVGTAFVFVTHDLATARHVCDRIAVMHRGRVVEEGDTDRVVEEPEHAYTRTLLAAAEGVA